MKISKEEYYEVRGNDYVLSHPEASIRYKRILKWLDLQPGMSICEIGCMFAIIRNLVQRTDVKYTGVDINEKAIKSKASAQMPVIILSRFRLYICSVCS